MSEITTLSGQNPHYFNVKNETGLKSVRVYSPSTTTSINKKSLTWNSAKFEEFWLGRFARNLTQCLLICYICVLKYLTHMTRENMSALDFSCDVEPLE